MLDLLIAILLLTGGCIAAMAAGLQTGRMSAQRSLKYQLTALAMMIGYLLFVWNRPILAQLLPESGLIVLANWLPIWGSFFVGIYLASDRINVVRKATLASIAVMFCFYSVIAPTLGESPVCKSATNHFLQHQTTPYTCSAACAVSLLHLHDIDATESELSELCLTRRGTHWMGLYRGLKLKTAGTDWDVVVEPLNMTVVRSRFDSPCVLSLQLDISGFPKGLDHGFQSDCGHSVLYLGNSRNDCITVFDPSPDYGVEDWDNRVMKCIDDGVVLRLVPRNPDSPQTIHVARRLAAAMHSGQLTAQL